MKGFFLSEHNVCLPCNCKGHADSCDDITGICRVSVVFFFSRCFVIMWVVPIRCNYPYDRIAGTTVQVISAKGVKMVIC